MIDLRKKVINTLESMDIQKEFFSDFEIPDYKFRFNME
jgi:hypothetical protein